LSFTKFVKKTRKNNFLTLKIIKAILLIEVFFMRREIAKEIVSDGLTEFYLLDPNAKDPVINYYPSISEPFGGGKLITYYEDLSII